MIERMKTSELKSMNYIGSSMNPTLKPGVRLDVSAYHGQKIRKGDVIVFIPPGGDSKIVHRVTSVNSDGIRTRGDNRNHEDDWVLSRDHILGRVVATQRNNRRRRIFGGPLGRFFAVTVRVIRAMDSPVSHLLRPAYNELAKVSIFTQLLPAQMRPRVISLNRTAGEELQVLMGRRVIGRLLPGMTRWHIRRPFRLFVDEEALPENKAEVSGVRFQV
ncbi:MAG: S26 family signal peptidase, partial [Syntrophobacterales bacterium]